jgi:hypothetical protein
MTGAEIGKSALIIVGPRDRFQAICPSCEERSDEAISM